MFAAFFCAYAIKKTMICHERQVLSQEVLSSVRTLRSQTTEFQRRIFFPRSFVFDVEFSSLASKCSHQRKYFLTRDLHFSTDYGLFDGLYAKKKSREDMYASKICLLCWELRWIFKPSKDLQTILLRNGEVTVLCPLEPHQRPCFHLTRIHSL